MQDTQTTGFGNYFPAVLQDWNPSEKKKKAQHFQITADPTKTFSTLGEWKCPLGSVLNEAGLLFQSHSAAWSARKLRASRHKLQSLPLLPKPLRTSETPPALSGTPLVSSTALNSTLCSYCDGKTSTPADPRTELALWGGQHILHQAHPALGGPTACRRGNPMAQAAYLGLVRQLHPLTEAQRQLLEG